MSTQPQIRLFGRGEKNEVNGEDQYSYGLE